MNEVVSLVERKLEQAMFNMPQIDCPVIHKFEPGKYIRELHMKAGTLIIGLTHTTVHINNFVEGKIMLVADNENKTLEAPLTFEGKPGRKIAYVLEDTIWQNIFETDIQDVALLEAIFFTKTDEFLDYQAHNFAMASVAAQIDRDDYEKAIEDLGLTQEQVHALCSNQNDQQPLPKGEYKVMLGLSPIEGQGIIATATIQKDEIIGPARVGGYRTPLGRYTNHAKYPNARMINIGEDLYLVANEMIYGMLGGLQGQEVTTDYRLTRKTIEQSRLGE